MDTSPQTEHLPASDLQVIVDVAILKTTQLTHDRRITALESNQARILWGVVVAAAGSCGTLLMFILAKVHF